MVHKIWSVPVHLLFKHILLLGKPIFKVMCAKEASIFRIKVIEVVGFIGAVYTKLWRTLWISESDPVIGKSRWGLGPAVITRCPEKQLYKGTTGWQFWPVLGKGLLLFPHGMNERLPWHVQGDTNFCVHIIGMNLRHYLFLVIFSSDQSATGIICHNDLCGWLDWIYCLVPVKDDHLVCP
jgi:hypothetical protein